MRNLFNNNENYDYMDEEYYYDDSYYNEYDDYSYDISNNPIQTNNSDFYTFEECSLLKKSLSFLIDVILSLGFHFILVYLFITIKAPYLTKIDILYWLIFILLFSFSINFIIVPSFIFRGQTLGQKFLHLKTVKRSGYFITLFDNIIRYVFLFLFLIDLLYMIISKDKIMLHHKILNTIVINEF